MRERPEWADATGWVDLDIEDYERPKKKNGNIKRETADRNLKEIVERIDHINNSPEFLYKVEFAAVFGSYLSDKERLGDLDVCVHVTTKFPRIHPRVRKEIEKAVAYEEHDYRGERGMIEAWFHHYAKVKRYLMNKKPYNSIHFVDDILPLLGHIKYEVVYGDPAEADRIFSMEADEYRQIMRQIQEDQEKEGMGAEEFLAALNSEAKERLHALDQT